MVAKRYEDRCGEEARLADPQSRGPARLGGVESLLDESVLLPVPRDHGPHAAGLEAQQPGDDEAARGYLSEGQSQGYRLRGTAGVPGRKEAGQLHRTPL